MSNLIKLDGSKNLRHVGGMVRKNNKPVSSGVFFRSGDLRHLTKSSLIKLTQNYKIKTILDLRRPPDAKTTPEYLRNGKACAYENIDLIGMNNQTLSKSIVESITDPDMDEELKNICIMYISWIENRKTQLKEIFDLLSNKNSHPILFHCAAGKDRTGVVAALLLSLVDIDINTIVDDYAISAEYLFENPLEDSPFETWQEYQKIASPPMAMIKTLTFVNNKYGSVPQYLKSIGISDDQIASIISVLS